ncbi:class D sortase [Paenibacillus methanolicus]|uniref:Sortase A n=1 Tax=Paenibacillus methanolicus TaxID=582686 RepID=A0A5S5BUQ0_9BACL|nr:class D sortase [Paenibacillus methanolicus]TYP70046.1 sortase A [Paenibacillus methanolicus]
MIKKFVPSLFILVGILVLLYPTLADRYEGYRQQRILQAWESNLRQLDMPEPEMPAVSSPTSAAQPDKPKTKPAAAKTPTAIGDAPVEGLLAIEAIDLRLPIVTDATPAHLKLSVASMLHTGKPGQVGNYAIAGHRNRTYGKNFNRLDEVKIGDVIVVETKEATYRYVVDSKQYVLPTQVEVLEGNGRDREITLITCHPMKNPTHRLIVKGKIQEKSTK